jgi:DNA-binding transcriptional regulator YiaG
MSDFNKIIRAMWEKSGMTQPAAAKAIGVSHRAFVTWVLGQNKPDPFKQEAILKKFDEIIKKSPQ